MSQPLSTQQQRAREILIRVATREYKGRKVGLISYKELWSEISKEEWSRAKTKTLVEIILQISAFELSAGRPPLNEVVVPVKAREPRQEWDNIKNDLKSRFSVLVPYQSHKAAQEACWQYWAEHPPMTDDLKTENS